MRPESWRTLEIHNRVGEKLAGQINDAEVVLLDCVTLLISNLLTAPSHVGASFLSHSEEQSPEAVSRLCHPERSEGSPSPVIADAEKLVMAEIEDLIKCIEKYEGNFIVVSNEVGLGLVPGTKLERVYRDLLGRANQLLAQHADEVYFMVSGIPMKING